MTPPPDREALLALKSRIHFIGAPNEPKDANGYPDWSKEIALLEAALRQSPPVSEEALKTAWTAATHTIVELRERIDEIERLATSPSPFSAGIWCVVCGENCAQMHFIEGRKICEICCRKAAARATSPPPGDAEALREALRWESQRQHHSVACRCAKCEATDRLLALTRSPERKPTDKGGDTT